MNHWGFKKNQLVFGLQETPLSRFTKNYKNPIYIYDLALIKQRVQLMQKYINGNFYYAVKANPNREILKLIKKLKWGVDIVSLGEAERALSTGFGPQDIILSGVGKTAHELQNAIQKNIYQINVESIPELQRISALSKKLKKKVRVALRVNPDVDIKTHPYIATGLLDNKFGIFFEDVSQAVPVLLDNTNISLVGLSMHLGSQMHDLGAFKMGLEKLYLLFQKLKATFPQMNSLDVGGGLGIYYNNLDNINILDQEIENLKEYASIISKFKSQSDVKILLEPGRWIVGHSGVLVCQVQYLKKNNKKTFAILDSGMNHLMRPSLYDAYHEIQPLNVHTNSKFIYDVVGPICETADFFARSRSMPELKEGDFVAILDVGAYGFSMANNYNLRPLPKEVCLKIKNK